MNISLQWRDLSFRMQSTQIWNIKNAALGAKMYMSLRFWITYNFEFDNFKPAERMLKAGSGSHILNLGLTMTVNKLKL